MSAIVQFHPNVPLIDRSGGPKRTRLVLLNFADDFALGTRSIAAHVRKLG